MPVRSRGGGCYQWGGHGTVYCGRGARGKAERQGRAAYSHGYRGTAHETSGARFAQEDASPLTDLIEATDALYPSAGEFVDGLLVREHVPNLSSIDGYFADSETLRGVRVVPMSDFGGPRSVFYAKNDFDRSERLAEAIRESGEINPLIIGVDKDGPFIIEGAHRFVALHSLRAKTFPAVVVVGRD